MINQAVHSVVTRVVDGVIHYDTGCSLIYDDIHYVITNDEGDLIDLNL